MENYLKVQLSDERLPAIKNLINQLLKLEGLTDITLNILSLGDGCLNMSFVKNSGEELTSEEKESVNTQLLELGIIYILKD